MAEVTQPLLLLESRPSQHNNLVLFYDVFCESTLKDLHSNITVEFSQSRERHFGTVLTDVRLCEEKLPRGRVGLRGREREQERERRGRVGERVRGVQRRDGKRLGGGDDNILTYTRTHCVQVWARVQERIEAVSINSHTTDTIQHRYIYVYGTILHVRVSTNTDQHEIERLANLHQHIRCIIVN